MDLKQYRTQALVDWVEIWIRLSRQTQARWINEKVAHETGVSPYVELVPTKPGIDVEFTLRIQDPTPAVVHAIIEVLELEWGLEVPPTIEAIEVAVDFYPKSHLSTERDKMFGVLTRHHDPDLNLARLRARPRSSAGVYPPMLAMVEPARHYER